MIRRRGKFTLTRSCSLRHRRRKSHNPSTAAFSAGSEDSSPQSFARAGILLVRARVLPQVELPTTFRQERAMTAATPGPSGPNLFSMFSSKGDGLYRTRPEAFAFSLIGQVVILGLLVYFMSVAIHDGPKIGDSLPKIQDL